MKSWKNDTGKKHLVCFITSGVIWRVNRGTRKPFTLFVNPECQRHKNIAWEETLGEDKDGEDLAIFFEGRARR